MVQIGHRRLGFAPGLLLCFKPDRRETSRGVDDDIVVHVQAEGVHVAGIAGGEERLEQRAGSGHDIP